MKSPFDYSPPGALTHVLRGGGKGGSPAPVQQGPATQTSYSTVNQSNLPDYVQPYFTTLLNQSASLGQAPYQPYQGDQIAPLTGLQNQAISATQANQGNYQPYFNAAGSGLASVQNTAQNTSFNPQQTQNTYGATNFNPQQYTGANVGQYMSPYLQQALAPQIQLQNQQFAQQANILDSKAAGNGAFGGYRNALEQSQNTLYNNLANQNLIGNAYNTAFGQAANQFNTSQQQQQQASQINNAQQQAQSTLGMQAAGQNNQYNLAAAQTGLQAGQLGLSAAQGLGSLGQATQAAGQADTNALLNAGTIQQNQQQTGLNTAYQNYLNQLYYPYQALNWESGILRGVPVTANQNVTGYVAPPSPVSQIAGLGLGAAGLAKMFGT